jgi:DNA-binding NtrC family response regulator
MIVCQGETLAQADLPLEKSVAPPVPAFEDGTVAPLKELLTETERKAILAALGHTGNNRAEAAKLLGIHRTGLYQKMKKHGIA